MRLVLGMGYFVRREAVLLLTLFAVFTNLGLISAILTDRPKCGDWKAYKDEKCFKLASKAGFQSQEDAEIMCESFSEELKQQSFPKLITIKTKEEQDFLHQFLFVDDHFVDNVWLGLKEVGNSGIFQWNDGSKVEFSNWANQTLADEDHHCVQMTSGKGGYAAGQWVKVHCGKRNEVICERTQTWTLETLQNMFLKHKSELEKEISLLKQENKLQRREYEKKIAELKVATQAEIDNLKENSVPAGFIYVQLAGQDPPSTLWPNHNWTDVTSTYAGLFFRAEGGNAAPFGQVQDENTKHLGQVEYIERGSHTSPLSIPLNSSWSPTVHTGIYYATYSSVYTLRFRLSSGEERPRNQAVKLWQRN